MVPAADNNERAERLSTIAQSIAQGTYLVPAEDVAAAIMSGPLAAYVRRLSLFDSRTESAEDDNDR